MKEIALSKTGVTPRQIADLIWISTDELSMDSIENGNYIVEITTKCDGYYTYSHGDRYTPEAYDWHNNFCCIYEFIAYYNDDEKSEEFSVILTADETKEIERYLGTRIRWK